MKIGDLVQHRLSPVVGIITHVHFDAKQIPSWADVVWADGRKSIEQIGSLWRVSCE